MVVIRRSARSSKFAGHRDVRVVTRSRGCLQSRTDQIAQRAGSSDRSTTPGNIALPAVGQSENLNILPGGFFAGLLAGDPPTSMIS
jgi:hypothetical protein